LQNPLFLSVFALPVIGAIFLSRWHPYATAAVAVAVVAGIALSEVPELRWYASGLSGAGAWFAGLFGREAGAVAGPFAGFYAPSGYFVVLLEVFAILLFACAVAAEYIGTIFDRLRVSATVARSEADRGQELWTMLIEQLPLPALLIDSDTLQVICVSEQAAQVFQIDDEPIAGRSLFELIHFSYPDIVQELILGTDGEDTAVVRVADQLLVTRIRVRHIAQKGHRFALLAIEDTTEAFCVKAALDNTEQAALVIDAHGRVIAFNKPASGLFGGIAAGVDAALLVPRSGSPARWWDPGFSGRRKMHLEISPRIYQLTSSAVALPGEEERVYIAAFLPVAKAEFADELSSGATMVTSTLAQRR
jgi:PAS domain-containing protein